MTRRTLLPVLVAGIALTGLAGSSVAAGKPVTKKFEATGKAPFANLAATGACDTNPTGEWDRHIETIKIPAAGKIVVQLTGFAGDWDMALFDAKGRKVAEGDNAAATPGTNTGEVVEKLTYKIKKTGTYKLHACNFAGSPNASGKYTFTPNK